MKAEDLDLYNEFVGSHAPLRQYSKVVFEEDLKMLLEAYHQSQLQALKNPKKIREIMKGSNFDHLKIEDEFGFTGEWRMSEKGVLDVIINLINNLEDNE